MVQDVPAQVNSGKMVRPPMVFPWVEETAMQERKGHGRENEKRRCIPATREILRPDILPWNNLMLVMVYCPLNAQSVFEILKVGCLRPVARYGGM